jgi:hypothetical protein
MLPEKTPKGSQKETVEPSPNEDPNLAKIRYYQGTFRNFFDYWKARGVKPDPYEGVELTHPERKIQNRATLPYQDFGTFTKSEKNQLTESFEDFMNQN